MSGKIVVTTGGAFTDIDGYASVIAYVELMQQMNKTAVAVLSGALNASIPEAMRNSTLYETSYDASQDDTFVILDASEPDVIPKFVNTDKISLIADHHAGFEDYWKQKNVRTQIEQVGAVCAQVFEYWLAENCIEKMTSATAQLLAAGILDNTLNFNASVTTQRDQHAYERLLQIAHLDTTWAQHYFHECTAEIIRNPKDALLNDTKYIAIAGFSQKIYMGQIIIWDAALLQDVIDEARQVYATMSPWFLNIMSVGERRNYILCDNSELQEYLMELLGIEFDSDIATTDRLYLRKEIIKKALENFEQ